MAFNGIAVNNNYSLLGYVRAAALGDKVTLTIVRDGKTMDVDVTLDQEESSVNGSSSSDSNGNSQNNVYCRPFKIAGNRFKNRKNA